MGIVPILLCPELNTILGAGTIFASGIFYGFMALGKKYANLFSHLCSYHLFALRADRGTMMGIGVADPAWSPQVNQPFPQGFNQP